MSVLKGLWQAQFSPNLDRFFMLQQISDFTTSIKQIVLVMVISWGIHQLGDCTIEPEQATGTAILFTYSFMEPFKKMLQEQLPVCKSSIGGVLNETKIRLVDDQMTKNTKETGESQKKILSDFLQGFPTLIGIT